MDQKHCLLSVCQGELLAHQDPGLKSWSSWLLLGGRGAGKTFAGARWLVNGPGGSQSRLGRPTLHDVREVMIDGPSGLRAMSGPRFRPRWEASRKRLVWPNGAVAYAFSAEDPDSLRGPQFHAAWADEFCAWPKPAETLAMLRFGLRLGEDPRLVVTTTPRPIRALKTLIAEPGVEVTRAGTAANADNLAPAFLSTLHGLYGGTRLAAQELDGVIVEDEGGLFRAEDLARCKGARPGVSTGWWWRSTRRPPPRATPAGSWSSAGSTGEPSSWPTARRKGLSPNGWARRAVAARESSTPTPWWPKPTRAATWSAPSWPRPTRPAR
jgi:phage terminase large subunit-like protein